MTCPRCGTANSVFETRCTRCGVPFGAPSARNVGLVPERANPRTDSVSTGVLPPGVGRPYLVNPQARFSAVISNAIVVPPVTQAGADHPNGLVSAGSTARRLDFHDAASPVTPPQKPTNPVERPQLRVAPPTAQPSLFQPGELPTKPPALRVHAPGMPAGDSELPPGALLPRRKPARKRAKSDMLPFAQGTLDFLTPTAPPTRQLRTKVDASILCDHHGASPTLRFAGTMVDGAYTLAAALLVAVFFWLALREMEIALPMQSQFIYWGLGAIWAGVILAYQTLFTFLDAETPGYRALQLRILNLDGSLPGRTQRWKRLLASFASAAPCGAGFLWALFDEEQLAWHDHISGTFPARESSIDGNFHRS